MSYVKKKARHSTEATKINNLYPENPDLLLLRDAAANERETIAFYLKVSQDIPALADLFNEIAKDEMQHYVMIMRHICMLDPIQAQEMKEVGREELAIMPRFSDQHELNAAERTFEYALSESEKNSEGMQYLTDALIEEFLVANKYHTYLKKAEVENNKRLFCWLLNDEKKHIAEFTANLFDFTGEPIAPVNE